MDYFLKELPDKKFTDKMDLTRYVKKNIREINFIKKQIFKSNSSVEGVILKNKINPLIESISSDVIEVKAVINTTNIIDNYMDLHTATIWNKTVKDNPHTYHLESHGRSFKDIIDSKAKQSNEIMNFRDLGLDVDFQTVANINTFLIDKKDNPEMFKRYVNGDVHEHSVGMRYINLSLAMYDEDDQKEMDFFNEKLKEAVNPEIAIEKGYFWVVSEAKKIEGSAVLFGANSITPTLYVKNFEPSNGTRDEKSEPLNNTQKKKLQLSNFIN
jgi:hypothetical protein